MILEKLNKHYGNFNKEKAMSFHNEMKLLLSKKIFNSEKCETDSVALRKEIKDFYTENFCNGDKDKAIQSLESRMKPYRRRDIFMIGFNIGFFSVQILYLSFASFFSNYE
jgi:hypothetical protein